MFFQGRFLPWVRRAGLWLLLPAIAVVAWGELTPSPPHLEGPWLWDKAQHFTAYFGIALLAGLAWGLRRALVLVWLGVIVLGGMLEIAQHYAGRDAEWLDQLANSLGATAGILLAVAYLAMPRRLVGKPRRD